MTHNRDLSGFATLFQALSDPTRLRLLALMSPRPVSVGYLSDQLGESQPKTSRHLGYLRNAGLVSTTREGKWVYYGIKTQPDAAIQEVLSVTLCKITGNSSILHPSLNDDNKINILGTDTYDKTYMSEWQPNEIEVHLL